MIYQTDALSVSLDEQFIATLTFHASGSVNKFNLSTLEHLNHAIEAMETQPKIKGLILNSNKASFIVGADITEFLSLFELGADSLSTWLSRANSIFNRLEDLPFPTLSAINGHALGGGCECVLSTDFRIGDPALRIGLPETKLGIMPGWGGSVRLPRIIGADSAMEIITAGKDCRSAEALKLGFVDAIVETADLNRAAKQMIQEAIDGKLNWQQRRQQKQQPLKLNKTEAMMSFATAKALVSQVAGKHYPAPIAAVSAIEDSARFDRNEALKVETQYFVKLTQTSAAKALVGIFLNDQYIKGKAKKACKSAPATRKAAVIGAGIMGGGIAYQSALKKIPVLMKDIAQPSLDLGMTEAAKLLNKRLEKGRIDTLSVAATLGAITPSLQYAGIEECDIVVEAVVENPNIKSAVLADVESHVSSDTVITSNTSTIPINLLARALKHPENFCGMHFFNPVHRMPLVEIIRGEKTSNETIDRVVAYAAQMGKSPIVVNDCPGFFVNRVLFPYFAAFNLLLRDGGDFSYIDKIMEKQFGWPMGPAYLLDVVGLDTAHHAQEVMAEGYPTRMGKQGRDAIDAMFAAQRFGQKNGTGFYQYSQDKRGKPKKALDESVAPLLAEIQSTHTTELSAEQIIHRMMIPMINEVVRCLEEDIIATPSEADMALVYGLGFPPFHGGAFRYLDAFGLREYVQIADELAHLGEIYHVPAGLRAKAEEGSSYYPKAPAIKAPF